MRRTKTIEFGGIRMMSNKTRVKALYLGIPHWLATCQDCDWQDEFSSRRKDGYKEVKKHVKQTGHTVSVESSHVTHYFVDEDDDN